MVCLMIKTVLFDLDNTLTDFMRMKEQSCDAAIRAMIDAGLDIDEEKAKKKIYELFAEHGMEDPLIFQRFLEKTIGEIDYRILSNAITAYRRAQIGLLCPYPKTRTTLVKLKEMGLKLGIVSDAPRLKAWLRLSEMNIAEFFDFVIALEDTGKLKPNKMPFEAAARKAGCMADEILFVGDNPERDILGAKNAGMKAALACYGQVVKNCDAKADYSLKEISDIIAVIKKNNA